MQFCDKNDVVLDAACGIEHPFKFYLAHRCREAHAVDVDKRVTSLMKIRRRMQKKLGVFNVDITGFKLSLQCCDIIEMPFPDKKFDKIFCISVLEHLSDVDKIKALYEFSRVIKDDGKLILTLDYPTTNFEKMERFVKDAGFNFVGDVNKSIPNNAITGLGLHCFRMVLSKRVGM